MKHLVMLLSLVIIGLVMVGSVSAQVPYEHIRLFEDDIVINKDGTVDITETIVYDFANLDRHGIYRDIPVIKRNTEGKKYKMELQVISVENEHGTAYEYDRSTEGDNVRLKIGDPDKTITGLHIYKIHYKVGGALTYFSDHDELYWNVTGNGWNIPILSSRSIVRMLQEPPSEELGGVCYTGYDGSSEQNCVASIAGSVVTFETTKQLNSSEGFTIAVRFPQNLVARLEPKEVVPFFDTVLGKITLVVLMVGAIWWYLLYPLWLPIRWFLYGRDPNQGKPATAWYDPPKTKKGRALTPAETGTLIDEHAGPREISALIVNLAQRGYFKIVEKAKDDYEFIKGKEYRDDASLEEFEQNFLRDLFSSKDIVRVKDRKLSSTVEAVQNKLYGSLVHEGYFPVSPKKTRDFYTVLAGIAGMTFNFPMLIMASIFGRLMPHKTADGVHAANVARSLKNFLTSQERQLKFQAEKQIMFEKMLPFAIAFGVEKIWAERFKDINLEEPTWYHGNYHGSFNSHSFTRSLNSSLSSFQTAATPVSSSTGHSSGFSGGSGGGGGGGGGGSW